MPSYTLEDCEELLRLNPLACARLYGKIRSEVKTMEVRESEHRWMIRRALADGPKTAMQASNWARQQGDQHMDRPLAESILRNLIKEEEVGVDVTVNAGKPPVFVATARMKQPALTESTGGHVSDNVCTRMGYISRADASQEFRDAALAGEPAPTFTTADLNRPMGNGALATAASPSTPPEPTRLTAFEIVALCADDKIGQRRTVGIEVEPGKSIRDVAQKVRMALNTRANTRSWKWSIHVVKARTLAVTKVGPRDEPTAQSAPIETPAPRVELASSEEIQMAASRNEIAPPAQAIIQERPDWTVQPPPGKPWAAGRAALAEVDGRIAKLIEMRGALLRVIPMMETGEVV